ncbi:BCCIP-like protein [Dorcoceras hygrometricum]|uniref:BCCIP-like protein n=1 Tax=Dorcoceras hygrometricum TaxID=472368 RepID=A0A2Z7ALM5_9LAMI|nr:BCCIP-like protein [Dorcoceras hygrometricum]
MVQGFEVRVRSRAGPEALGMILGVDLGLKVWSCLDVEQIGRNRGLDRKEQIWAVVELNEVVIRFRELRSAGCCFEDKRQYRAPHPLLGYLLAAMRRVDSYHALMSFGNNRSSDLMYALINRAYQFNQAVHVKTESQSTYIMPQNTNTLMLKAVNKSSTHTSALKFYLNRSYSGTATSIGSIGFLACLNNYSRNYLKNPEEPKNARVRSLEKLRTNGLFVLLL